MQTMSKDQTKQAITDMLNALQTIMASGALNSATMTHVCSAYNHLSEAERIIPVDYIQWADDLTLDDLANNSADSWIDDLPEAGSYADFFKALGLE